MNINYKLNKYSKKVYFKVRRMFNCAPTNQQLELAVLQLINSFYYDLSDYEHNYIFDYVTGRYRNVYGVKFVVGEEF